ncbi:hypothetical protein ACIQU8_22205 [Streptomyces griseus]|uniref:hypothetical protein n=1 Tax=Streptomyces griseus TaxID=1911 RepID=UPI0037FD3D07
MLPRTTTANTAREMNRVRAALSEPRISYLGASYGTRLGAVYTQLSPERGDRIVLDSVLGRRGYDVTAFRLLARGMEDRFPTSRRSPPSVPSTTWAPGPPTGRPRGKLRGLRRKVRRASASRSREVRSSSCSGGEGARPGSGMARKPASNAGTSSNAPKPTQPELPRPAPLDDHSVAERKSRAVTTFDDRSVIASNTNR